MSFRLLRLLYGCLIVELISAALLLGDRAAFDETRVGVDDRLEMIAFALRGRELRGAALLLLRELRRFRSAREHALLEIGIIEANERRAARNALALANENRPDRPALRPTHLGTRRRVPPAARQNRNS